MKKIIVAITLATLSLACLTNYGMERHEPTFDPTQEEREEHQDIALQIVNHPRFTAVEGVDWNRALALALQRNQRDIAQQIIQHPQFNPVPAGNILRESLEKAKYPELLQVSIEATDKGNLTFNIRKNIPANTLTITMKTPTLPSPKIKQLEIAFVYNTETKKPIQITTTKYFLGQEPLIATFDYPPEASDKNVKKIEELALTVMKHPYVKKILHPELEEKEFLKERIEFIPEQKTITIQKKKIILFPKIFDTLKKQ